MLTCSNCQSTLKLNAKLCIKCGHVVTDEERESAVTGVPIKKPEVVPETVISESLVDKEDMKFIESTTVSGLSLETERTSLSTLQSPEKLDVDLLLEVPASNQTNDQSTLLNKDEPSEPPVEVALSSAPTFVAPPHKNEPQSKQEKTTNNTTLPSKSNSKLIGVVIASFAIIGVGTFLFLSGNKTNEAPMASVPTTNSASPPVLVAPASEAQPVSATLPKSIPPTIAQPTNTASVPTVQKQKPSGQQSDDSASMPDLNKLVKDAINK